MGFALISESFIDKGMIPARYTCDGWDISPSLFWTPPPEPTKSLVLLVDDPDALQTSWVHWLLYNIPPDANTLPEGVAAKDLPHGCRQGKNDWGNSDYGGPYPPSGRHRYRYTLYALDSVLPNLDTPLWATLEKAMAGHVIAHAELTGTYQRLHN